MSLEYLRALICIQEISGTTSGCSLCTSNNAGSQWYQEHRMGSVDSGWPSIRRCLTVVSRMSMQNGSDGPY